MMPPLRGGDRGFDSHPAHHIVWLKVPDLSAVYDETLEEERLYGEMILKGVEETKKNLERARVAVGLSSR
jgi:hypothetical protein